LLKGSKSTGKPIGHRVIDVTGSAPDGRGPSASRCGPPVQLGSRLTIAESGRFGNGANGDHATADRVVSQ
jgi:hypothetical protein